VPSLYDDTTTGLPQTTRSGIYYEVDTLAYREEWVPANNRTTILVRVDAYDAFQFVTDMVGESYVTGTTLSRHLPEQNPFDPNQWCVKAVQQDQGGENEDETYSDAASGWPFTRWVRYVCTFESLLYKVLTDTEALAAAVTGGTAPELLRYCTRAQSTYAREQQIPGGGFQAIGTGDKLMQTGFKTRAFGDVTYVRIRVPCGHFPAAFKTHRGKINDAAFDAVVEGDEYDFAAGELLYVGYDDNNKYWDANEDWVCDVVLKFKYCAGGWNFFFNNLGTLVEVSSDGTSGGTKPYSTADMTDLFEVS
jgi:hypothetical protein